MSWIALAVPLDLARFSVVKCRNSHSVSECDLLVKACICVRLTSGVVDCQDQLLVSDNQADPLEVVVAPHEVALASYGQCLVSLPIGG